MSTPTGAQAKAGSYFPPPNGMRPQGLAPILGKPPMPGGMDQNASGRFKRKQFESTDQSVTYNTGGRHRRGGSMSIPDQLSNGGFSSDRLNRTGPQGGLIRGP